MTEQLTVYRAEGKNNGTTILFKYDLNGYWKSTELAEGKFQDDELIEAFRRLHPFTELDFKERWLNNPNRKKQFDITISPADLSFEAFWSLYNLKVKRAAAEKLWNKLSEAERILCFNALPKYEAFLRQTGQAKAHLATWLNGSRWLDEYPEQFTPPPKERVGKVFNNALHDLASKKTEK